MTEPAADEPQRTWLPFVLAAAVALLVIAVAVFTSLARADLSAQKQAAVESCEAAWDARRLTDPSTPALVGGEVFSAVEWRDLNATLDRLGYLPASEKDLSGEERSARQDEADELVAQGKDRVTIVWQLDGQSHATCVADIQDDAVVGEVAIALLTGATPGATPSPTASTA